jgi:hypothetical protein
MGEKAAIRKFYTSNAKQCNKTIHYMLLAPGQSYKDVKFEQGFQGVLKFYSVYKKGGDAKEILEKTFWENAMYRKSAFFKFYVDRKEVKVEIYRDDGHGGPYSLRHSLFLN